ncbi:MAG TPA: hypothetical protein VNV82_17830 [Bryobacteraceae bacterium]|jgi:hypothetical protein|nr:hypothetical protein [Bryobacteraceae bacterium]
MGILSTAHTREAEAITDGEGEVLLHILNLMRSPQQKPWLTRFFEGIAIHGDEKQKGDELDLEKLMDRAVEAFNECTLTDSIGGCLFAEGEDLIAIEQREYKSLAQYLAVVRSRNWLHGFLSVECLLFEQGHRRTPLEVIKGLDNERQEFECNQIITRQMLADHGGMFSEEIEALKEAAKEPVPDEVISKPVAQARVTRVNQGTNS